MAEGKGGAKVVWIVLGVIALLGLLCCGGGAFFGVGAYDAVMDAGEQADAVVDEFYGHLSAEDYEAAHAMMVPAYRDANDVSGITQAGSQINSVMGAYEGSTRTNIKVNVNAGVTIGSAEPGKVPGTSVTATYSATFANGEGTLEMVLQQQPDDSWQVWKYKVDSPLFLK